MEFPVPTEMIASGMLRVPRGAFEMWAVARSGGGHLATPWKPIAPDGLKMSGDDRFHSDWLLGSGLKLDAMRSYGSNRHWEAFSDAAHNARWEIESRLLRFRCSVLLPGSWRRGIVFVPKSPSDFPPPERREHPPVVLLPDAGPDYLDIALLALDAGGGVIVERGGEMAHLITVMRERGEGPILRVPDARLKYPPDAIVDLSCETGEVTLVSELFPQFANDPDPFGNGSRYIRKAEDDPLPVEPDNVGVVPPSSPGSTPEAS
jgi:hypothetical protein